MENNKLQDRVQINASNYHKQFGIPAINKWFADEVSRQNDVTNCGVYCCFYATQFIEDFTKTNSIKTISFKMEMGVNEYKDLLMLGRFVGGFN